MICCDICKEPIEGKYYEMPDGLIVCADSDCLEDWAENYAMPAEVNNGR